MDVSLDSKFEKGPDNQVEKFWIFLLRLFLLSGTITKNMLKNLLHFVIFYYKGRAYKNEESILTIIPEEMIICE